MPVPPGELIDDGARRVASTVTLIQSDHAIAPERNVIDDLWRLRSRNSLLTQM
jgi:hypothetical protein